MDLITLRTIYIFLDIFRYVSHSKIEKHDYQAYVPSNVTLWLCVYTSIDSAYSNKCVNTQSLLRKWAASGNNDIAQTLIYIYIYIIISLL